MASIKTEQFCSLSTSPAWQSWLWHFNQDMFHSFINKLQQSRGCTANRELMTDVLAQIDKIPDGMRKLWAFLSEQYPHMLVDELPAVPAVKSVVFSEYNPSILTYPRRIIFSGPDAGKQFIDFVSGKLKIDHITVDGSIYVEYLLKSDQHLVDKIPEKSWQIRSYKAKNSV